MTCSNRSLPSHIGSSSSRNFSHQEDSPLKQQRPCLSRIDPSASSQCPFSSRLSTMANWSFTGRSPLVPGELTPTSSLSSPVSSDRNSPFRYTPTARRPPSPEWSNLDCAFPPFPTNKNKNKVGSGTKHSSSSSSGRISRRPSEDKSLARKPAAYGTGMPLRSRTTDTPSRPSTASSSRQNSLGSNALFRKASADGVPPLPERAGGTDKNTGNMTSPLRSIEATQSSPWRDTSLSPVSSTVPSLDPVRESASQESILSAQFYREPRSTRPSVVRALTDGETSIKAKDPFYKSKRPTPLRHMTLDSIPTTSKVQAPIIPTPTSAARLGRSLTGLLSRVRSRSAAGPRKRVPLEIDDDVPAMPTYRTNDFGSTPKDFPGASHQSVRVEDVWDPPTSARAQILSPSATSTSEGARSPSRDYCELENRNSGVATASSERAAGTQIDARLEPQHLRHASIDSASSYGSVGFSGHTTSSRSSAPPVEEPKSKLQEVHNVPIPTVSLNDIPSVDRPHASDTVPESPTDPLFQAGRLSPIPPIPSPDSMSRQQSLQVLESQELSSERATQPKLNTKGICRGCSLVILASQKSVSSADGSLTGRYHKECFTCRTCASTFPGSDFYVHDDQPYCAQHYHELNGSLCSTCGNGIEGLYMQTSSGNGKRYHPHCLICATCKCRLNEDYFDYVGKMYCERDAFRLANLPTKYDTAPSRPSPLVREYISSIEPGLKNRFPERRTTQMMI